MDDAINAFLKQPLAERGFLVNRLAVIGKQLRLNELGSWLHLPMPQHDHLADAAAHTQPAQLWGRPRDGAVAQ